MVCVSKLLVFTGAEGEIWCEDDAGPNSDCDNSNRRECVRGTRRAGRRRARSRSRHTAARPPPAERVAGPQQGRSAHPAAEGTALPGLLLCHRVLHSTRRLSTTRSLHTHLLTGILTLTNLTSKFQVQYRFLIRQQAYLKNKTNWSTGHITFTLKGHFYTYKALCQPQFNCRNWCKFDVTCDSSEFICDGSLRSIKTAT